jgi:hypothetical protein
VAWTGGIEDRKDVEEVAADGAGGPVVARDLPAVGLDAGQEDEGALDPLGNPELALEQLRVGRRGSGSVERGDRIGAARVDAE